MTRFTTPLSRAAHSLHSRSRSPRNVLGIALALFATFGAITAVAALVPETTPASASAETAQVSTATGTSTGTAAATSATPASADSAPASSTAEADDDDSQSESEASATSSATGSAAARAAANANPSAHATKAMPHSNGHGCDDIIHAEDRTPTPGGPVGCTVGASGDHRQNGKTATATPTAASPSATGTVSASATKADPHSNGHGCDDIIHAEGRTPGPGGPVGCTVGNSGDHRQNGAHGAATATETATASGTGSPGSTAASGRPGNSGKKAK